MHNTKVVRSNAAHGEMDLMQHYVIKFVSDVRQVGGFLRELRFIHQQNWRPRYSLNNNILLKVALNTTSKDAC